MEMLGEVYFITNGEAIKIGFSGAPELRIKDLQSSNSEHLKILRRMPGTMDDEKRLHKQFAHLRLRGEWFRPDPELMAFIEDANAANRQIEEVRQQLAKWAVGQTGHVKTVCNSLDVIFRALVEGRTIWEPAKTIAHNVESLRSAIASQRARTDSRILQ